MLTEVKTIADFQKLPHFLQYAINTTSHNPHGLRFRENINRAERKTLIQNAVRRAIVEGLISMDLGIEILVTNNAYGPKGKAALKDI